MSEPQTIQVSDRAPTFDHCPACMYDLTGITLPTRCPECGLHVDEDSRIFFPSGRIRIGSAILQIFNLMFLGLVLSNGKNSNRPTWARAISFLVAGFLILSTVEYLVRRFRYSSPTEFLMVSIGEIFLRVRGRADVSIPWSQVRQVSHSKFSEFVFIHVNDKKHPVPIPRFFWPKKMPLRDFAAVFEEAHQNAQTHG